MASSGQARIDFVKANAPLAKMLLSTYGNGLLAETMVVQAILESTGKVNGVWLPGGSGLARNANNYYGIKADPSWKGDTYLAVDTGEGGNAVPWRKYPTPQAGAADYVKFLQTNRYAKVRAAKTPYDQFRELQAAGYASSSKYADSLSQIYDALKPTFKQVLGREYTRTGKVDDKGTSTSSGNSLMASIMTKEVLGLGVILTGIYLFTQSK